ncbi:MAG: hypothetical protein ACRD8O_17475 [Bryobacteraceae bacterium]
MRAGCLLAQAVLLFSAVSFAQIGDLATTFHGDQLYFSTSLRLKNTESADFDKIVRWSEDSGFTIFAQRRTDEIRRGVHLRSPVVSADGRIVSFLGWTHCHPILMGCFPFPVEAVIVRDGEPESFLDLYFYRQDSAGRFALKRYPSCVLRDLTEDSQTPLPHEACTGVFTADGRLVFATSHLHLWSPEEDRVFELKEPAASLAVSADGGLIAFTTASGLFALNTSSRNLTLLDAAARTYARNLRLSDDGSFVLYLRSPGTAQNQAFLSHTDASIALQITNVTEGVRDATISGNGRVVYVVTNFNRMLRYHVDTGETREIAPVFPMGFPRTGDVVRGSLVSFTGWGLSNTTATASFPLPTTFRGVHLDVGGVALPILSVSPHEITAQIPFDMPLGHAIYSFASSDSQFERPPYTITIHDFKPSLNSILHDDLTRPVTQQDAARPGEIITLVLSGLGAVDPALATGLPAPKANPPRVATPLTLRLRRYYLPAEVYDLEVLSAALAPGTIGRYHLTVRLPDASKLNPEYWGYYHGSIELESELYGLLLGGLMSLIPVKP